MVLTLANWVDGFQAVDEPDPSAPGEQDSFVVTNLAPATKYIFAVRTSDEALNWSPVSNLDSIYTTALEDCTLAPSR
jgi:chitodextrinase